MMKKTLRPLCGHHRRMRRWFEKKLSFFSSVSTIERMSYSMGKFTGVLLVSDYDNTLLNTNAVWSGQRKSQRLSDRNRAALEAFMDQGGHFAMATGRALVALEQFAGDVPTNCPAILCNGAAMYDFQTKAYLESIVLPEDICAHCQAVLDRFPTTAAEVYPLLENAIHAVRPNIHTRHHQQITHAEVREDPDMAVVPQPVTKLLLEDDRPVLEQLDAILRAQPWIGSCELCFSATNLLELTGKGANKGGMVRRLAGRLGISMDHVYCVGDQENDLSMLRSAAQGFAPANCADAVRTSGAVVVSDCDHDALADVVDILDKKYR